MNTTINRAEAVRRFKKQYPEASDILLSEDKCPSCKRGGVLYSAVVPPYVRTWEDKGGILMESVAFYCVSCRWGNAGSRPSLDGDSEVSEA